MPFTPYHVGPGVPIKAILQDRFSLIIFSGAQVVIDLQPLVVLLTGRGEIHGSTHTLLGATVLGIGTALVMRYPTQWLLNLFRPRSMPRVEIKWKTAYLSALLGTISHAVIDALIYPDVEPFWPFSAANPLRSGITTPQMITFCWLSGVVGLVLYIIARSIKKARTKVSPLDHSSEE